MGEQSADEAATRFLRRCDADSTRLAYQRELRRFLAWLPHEPGPDLLLDYRDALRARGLGRTTVRWRLTVVRAYLVFARDQGAWDTPLDLDWQLPRGQRGFAPRVLSRGQRKRLLQVPDRRTWVGARDAALLACLALGGLRASEVCALRMADIVSTCSALRLRVQGKGAKLRVVDLAFKEADAVRVWRRRWSKGAPPDRVLYPRSEQALDAPLDAHAIGYVVRKHAARAELADLHPHALRHTAATLAIEHGVPLHHVQAALGHASLVTTARYLQLR